MSVCEHSRVVSTDSGDLYVWGKNRSACLGLGHVLDQFFPYKVSTESMLLLAVRVLLMLLCCICSAS